MSINYNTDITKSLVICREVVVIIIITMEGHLILDSSLTKILGLLITGLGQNLEHFIMLFNTCTIDTVINTVVTDLQV